MNLVSFFHIFRAEPVQEKEDEEEELQDEAELLLEKVEEEMATVFSDEDDENVINIDDLRNVQFQKVFSKIKAVFVVSH